jgi:hypothetical protein
MHSILICVFKGTNMATVGHCQVIEFLTLVTLKLTAVSSPE